MSNRLLLSFALIALMAMTAAARTIKYVELGVNRSTFRHESCTPGYGVSVEFGMDYYPWQKFGGFWGWGLGFQNKKIITKDRIWAQTWNQRDKYFAKGDIHVNIQFIDIPIHIGYSMRINEQTTLILLSGPTLHILLKDESNVENKKEVILEKNEAGKYDYDYTLVDESGAGSSYNIYFGCKIIHNRFFASLRNTHALVQTSDIFGISISDEIDSFIISFGYNF